MEPQSGIRGLRLVAAGTPLAHLIAFRLIRLTHQAPMVRDLEQSPSQAVRAYTIQREPVMIAGHFVR